MITEDEAFWAGIAVATMMLGGGFSMLFLRTLTGEGAIVLSLGLLAMALTIQLRARPRRYIEDWTPYEARDMTPTSPMKSPEEAASETPDEPTPTQPQEATEYAEQPEPEPEPTQPSEQAPQPQPTQPEPTVEHPEEPPKAEKPEEEPIVIF